MSGLGLRFSDYSVFPKPLIDIKGKPMIKRVIESLNLKARYIFIVQQSHCDLYNLDQLLTDIHKNSVIIKIDYVTDGPACSALLAKDVVNTEDELIIANCDQIMRWNSELFLHSARFYDGCLVTYDTNVPHNSYVKLNKFGNVLEVKEKQVISNISTNGVHYWKKGKYFIDSAELMIYNKDTAPNGEYYVAPTFNYMINYFKQNVGIFHLAENQHNSVGVPDDLYSYLNKFEYECT